MSRHIESQREQWPHRVTALDQGCTFRCRIAMPMPTTLQLSGEQPDYTGSHGMKVYQDQQGDWSLKQPKPSLAFTVPLEAAAANLQRSMGLEAPESHVINHQGKPAVVSRWYPNSTQAWNTPPRLADLSPEDHMAIQKNHVLDWMIGNHDSHVGNWMRTQDDKLVSIDKGQAAKYFGHDRLDPHFHPNYYAREPIYNQLWRDHSQGHGQMHDPRTGELGAFVKQVQSIPDEKLKGMFRDYAHSAAQSGLLLRPDDDPSRDLGPRTVPANNPEAFLNALVARKNNLHNDLGDYYDRMSGGGREFVGAARGRGRPPSIPYEQNSNPLPLEHFGPEPENRLYNQADIIDYLGMSSNGFRALVKNRQAPAPSHLTPTGKPVWQDLRHWDYWRTNGGDSPHQDPSGTIHGINEVAKGIGISPTLMRTTIQESGNIPPHTHVLSDRRGSGDSPAWDDLQPWREWLNKRPRTLRGRPRNDGRLSPTHVDYTAARTPTADPGQAQGDRLYLPGDVADHLGVPRPTLMSWIYNEETPTPTHTSKPHEEMWDNLNIWDKWYTRRKSLEAGPRGYPDGWSHEFQTNKKPQRMLTIPDISQQTGMSLSDVYKSVYRPHSGGAKLPRNTHFAVGDDGRGVHFWDSLRPTKKRERGHGDSHTASRTAMPWTPDEAQAIRQDKNHPNYWDVPHNPQGLPVSTPEEKEHPSPEYLHRGIRVKGPVGRPQIQQILRSGIGEHFTSDIQNAAAFGDPSNHDERNDYPGAANYPGPKNVGLIFTIKHPGQQHIAVNPDGETVNSDYWHDEHEHTLAPGAPIQVTHIHMKDSGGDWQPLTLPGDTRGHTASRTAMADDDDPYPTIDSLAQAGYNTDEWKRWQGGGCLDYAHALLQKYPHLQAGALYTEDGEFWDYQHHFAHDDKYAYDSAGRHPLPYRGVRNNMNMLLNDDLTSYDEPEPDELAAAHQHIERNKIGPHTASRTAAPIDWSRVRSGPLVDTQLREQDPDNYFSWRPYSGPVCETCDRPTRLVSGPHCRHGSHTAGISDQPDDVTNDYSLAEFLQWCAHNHKDPDRTALSEYAAVSGMDPENYLDIYLFLQI